MTGESALTLVMAEPRKGLMRAAPARSGQVVSKRERRVADETKEKSPDFSNAEGNHDREIRRRLSLSGIGCFWLRRLEHLLRLFLSTSSSPLACNAAKKAMASIERVMCRYQPCQERTSYSSRPTSPFPSSKHCSTVQRAPKATTISSKEVPVGAKIRT